MITQRAWLVGFVGFCFYLIAIVNTLPAFYYALTWLSVGVLASSMGIALLSLIGLRCGWRVPRAIVTENLEDEQSDESGPILEVKLANAGTLNKTGVLIEARLQPLRASASDTESGTETDTQTETLAPLFARRFLLEALPSGSSVLAKLPLSHLPRGRYRVEELRLIGSDVLGLFRIQKRVPPGEVLNDEGEQSSDSAPAPTEIVVGPAAVAIGESATALSTLTRGDSNVPATRFLGQGDEIRNTRLYAPGDDLRHVHWKSTARRGQLVVKEFHHTMQAQVLVLWDGASQTNWGATENESDTDLQSSLQTSSLEWSLRLVASLCRALEERRQPYTLMRLNTHPLWLGAGRRGEAETTLPEAALPNAALPNAALPNAPSMAQVAQALCDADADRITPLSHALGTLRRSGGLAVEGGDVYLVTASLSSELPQLASRWRVAGARVVVGLVNGAAFLESIGSTPQKTRAFALPLQSAPPLQSWKQSDAKEESAAVTVENYVAQARALRTAGAHVVELLPAPGKNAELAALRSALNAMLHAGDRNEHDKNSEVKIQKDGAQKDGAKDESLTTAAT